MNEPKIDPEKCKKNLKQVRFNNKDYYLYLLSII